PEPPEAAIPHPPGVAQPVLGDRPVVAEHPRAAIRIAAVPPLEALGELLDAGGARPARRVDAGELPADQLVEIRRVAAQHHLLELLARPPRQLEEPLRRPLARLRPLLRPPPRVPPRHVRYRLRFSITWCALRVASAWMVSAGLTPIGVGNRLASATISRSASCTRPWPSVTERARSPPIRAVPIMWTVTTSRWLLAMRWENSARTSSIEVTSGAPASGRRMRRAPTSNRSSHRSAVPRTIFSASMSWSW